MTPPDVLAPTYVQMLQALSAWIGKAEAQRPGGGAETLLSARLAPDMFPLSTQIRFACVQALEGVCRLRELPLPALADALLAEGRAAGQPGRIADAQARIDETIAMVRAIAATPPGMDAGAPLAHALPNGIVLDLTVERYARDWALPQFYFHLMVAYAILRAEGVDLGKADYVAHMFAYLRPGTMPS